MNYGRLYVDNKTVTALAQESAHFHGPFMQRVTWSEGMPSISATVRGVATVAERRGPGFFSYLARRVWWPRAAYGLSWGASAPPVVQGVFAAVSDWSAKRMARAT